MSGTAKLRLLAAVMSLCLASCQSVVVHDVHSTYSHIQVLDHGARRSMVFLGDKPDDAVETSMDLRNPERLQHLYTRTLAAGIIYRPDASSCLLIGLGGGSLVRFFNYYFPHVALDVVEIDPVVVSVSREYFGTVPGPQTRIFVEDGFQYLRRVSVRYDLIIMNAHLHPGAGTDHAGMPLSFQEVGFLKGLHERLLPGGVVMFNIVASADTAAYIRNIRAAFPAVEIFRPRGGGNVVVMGAATRPPEALLLDHARALDRRGDYGFSFERLLDERGR